MNTTRLILTMSLCLLGLMIFQAWQEDYGRPRPAAVAEPASPAPTVVDSPAVPVVPTEDVPAVVAAPQADVSASEVSVDPVRLTSESISVWVSPLGGVIERVDLLRYPVDAKDASIPVSLLKPEAGQRFVAEGGLLGPQGVRLPTHVDVFAVQEQTDKAVVLRYQGDGLDVTKTVRLGAGPYDIHVDYDVRNDTSDTLAIRAYTQLSRQPPPNRRSLIYTFTGTAFSSPADRYEKYKFDKLVRNPIDRDSAGGWVAMLQHYFVAALVPDQAESLHYYAKASTSQKYPGSVLAGYYGPARNLPAGGDARLATRLYVGPKLHKELAKVAPNLELTVDYGILWIIAKPLFWLLDFIHELIGNWGWSIIILTILIKLAFFQLSAAGYRSMAKMRKIQPRLIAMRERYANDRQRLNQAMMDMYKEEKINPLGGCLPILVQIPFFISLYWVLLESVELRQATFILWYTDLSSRDPYFLLPLVMGVSMFAQQKLNPAPLDPMQEKIMQTLPIVFTVFFAFFPAGLVLYWVVNNVLSIVQQWVITKKYGEPTTAAAKN